MNKICCMVMMALLAPCAGHSQNEKAWDEAKNLAVKIGSGAVPSQEAGKLGKTYTTLLADDQNLIIALQDSEGGCVVIFPSINEAAFFRSRNMVLSTPVGASGNADGRIIWDKAVLDRKNSSDDAFVVKFHRKNGARIDKVTLNKSNKGNLANWEFDIMD